MNFETLFFNTCKQSSNFFTFAKPFICMLKVRYDDELKRVVCEPVEMAQEFRRFDFQTPWETFPAHRRNKEETQQQIAGGDQTPNKK